MTSRRRTHYTTLAALCLLLCLFGDALLPGRAVGQDAAATAKTFNFAVIGDTGTGEKPQYDIAGRMMAARSRAPFETVIMLGDNIYGGGKPKYFKPRFEEPYKDLLAAGVKFYASLGNHDAPYAEEHSKYPLFNMGGRLYYSFTGGDGLVEFFALDTNEVKDDQLKWLDEALGQSKAKWKVVFHHHALYSSAKMHRPHLKLRAQLEPLFIKHKVNVVFAGHSHAYERIKPQQGVHYYTAGSGGKLMKGTLDRKSTLTLAGNDQIQIFLLVRVDEKKMHIEAITSAGGTFDTSMVER